MKITQALDALKNSKQISMKLGTDEVLAVTKNAIVVRFYKRGSLVESILAAKIGASIVGNSSRLGELLSHRESRASVSSEQETLANLVSMIPFEVMKQAGLSLATYKELDRGSEETVFRLERANYMSETEIEKLKSNPLNKDFNLEMQENEYSKAKRFFGTYMAGQHFTGARLFSVGSETFLMDVDRNELQHGIINPFLVKLTSSASSLADAYEGLKPQDVKQALANGLNVQRQGEWFMIPVDEVTNARLNKMENKSGILRAGLNRPNDVEQFLEVDGLFYVRGAISHRGREHKEITLESWHRAMPNTATVSWQITGDID